MKAVTGDLPTAEDDEWAYEIKWDGMRAVAQVGGGELCLRTARGQDMTTRFPELVGLPDAVAAEQAVLDGEIVVLDTDGRPDFGRLQRRMHVDQPAEAARRSATEPAVLMVFDVLHTNGRDLLDVPYVGRRRLLEQLVAQGPRWQVPANHRGDGAAMLDAVRDRQLEGLLAKRIDSTYQPGRRSPGWRKVKIRHRQEFVVGGWLEGLGYRAGKLGALLIGYHDAGTHDTATLRYAGGVGAGLSHADLDHLTPVLQRLETTACPFDPRPPLDRRREPRWVEPRLVVELAFGGWTTQNRLRHPSFLGQRTDKDPAEVVKEPDIVREP